jgi:hypothetical protein
MLTSVPPGPTHLLGLVPQRFEVAPQLVGADAAVVVGVQLLKGGAQLLRLILAGKPLLRGGGQAGWVGGGGVSAGGASGSVGPPTAPGPQKAAWALTRDSSVAMAARQSPVKQERDVGWLPCVPGPARG